MPAYVNQHLTIAAAKFLIIPNCGKGDCLFKAISQAVYDGDDQSHSEVRIAVVDYVVARKWDFLKETIEVQHVQQNEHLQKAWTEDPVSAYRNYMTSSGALGSLSELTAAAGLFKFNFVTVQEYDLTEGISYRVENCRILAESQVPLYFFFFTGDFDNGHWEYLHPIGIHRKEYLLSDGIHCGTITTVINGEECSLDNWLKIHTENTNNPFDLKCDAFSRIPASNVSPYPFDSDIQLENGRTISLYGERFRIHRMKYTDLFSVITSILFKGCDNEATISQIELELLEYRIQNFSDLNDKLIRQPYSHGFTLTNLKYVSMPSKGNVQDLLAASCLRGFSFRIYFQPTQSTLESCTFIPPDRWGGQPEKLLCFFMKLVNSPKCEQVIAKWWHLVPDQKLRQGKDSNDNFFSGGSSSDTMTDQDELVRKVGKQNCTVNPLKRISKEAFTRNTPQQTENFAEQDEDNCVQLHSLPETSVEELKVMSSSGSSETCMRLVNTIVETYNESRKVSQESCDKTQRESCVSEETIAENRNPIRVRTDANNNNWKNSKGAHKKALSEPTNEYKTSDSASIMTVPSDASVLNSTYNSHWRPRNQMQTTTKKSLWRTLVQKCLPCANAGHKRDD